MAYVSGGACTAVGETKSRKSTHQAVQQGKDQASCSQKPWTPFNFVFARCKINVLCYKEMEIVSHRSYQFSVASANLSLHTWQGKEYGEKQDQVLFAKHFHQSKNCQGCEYYINPDPWRRIPCFAFADLLGNRQSYIT